VDAQGGRIRSLGSSQGLLAAHGSITPWAVAAQQHRLPPIPISKHDGPNGRRRPIAVVRWFRQAAIWTAAVLRKLPEGECTTRPERFLALPRAEGRQGASSWRPSLRCVPTPLLQPVITDDVAAETEATLAIPWSNSGFPHLHLHSAHDIYFMTLVRNSSLKNATLHQQFFWLTLSSYQHDRAGVGYTRRDQRKLGRAHEAAKEEKSARVQHRF